MKKKLLAAAVGASLATAASVGQAESLLFPYFQSGNGVFSFLTLLNTASAGGATSATLSYVWVIDYLNTAAVECEHNDSIGSMTLNDIIHQDVLSPAYGGLNLPALFGDAASAPAYITVSPIRGFMIVSTIDTQNAAGVSLAAVGGESTLAGQMTVVNAATGFVSAQKGLNNAGSTAAGQFNNILTSHPTYDMTWYPTSHVDTQWYVLVTGTNMAAAPGWAGSVQMNSGYGVAFDQDENPASGNVPVNITCHAFLERSDFLTQDQQNKTKDGGYYWGVFALAADNFNTNPATQVFNSSGVLMTKHEQTALLGGVATSSMENAWPNLPY